MVIKANTLRFNLSYIFTLSVILSSVVANHAFALRADPILDSSILDLAEPTPITCVAPSMALAAEDCTLDGMEAKCNGSSFGYELNDDRSCCVTCGRAPASSRPVLQSVNN